MRVGGLGFDWGRAGRGWNVSSSLPTSGTGTNLYLLEMGHTPPNSSSVCDHLDLHLFLLWRHLLETLQLALWTVTQTGCAAGQPGFEHTET